MGLGASFVFCLILAPRSDSPRRSHDSPCAAPAMSPAARISTDVSTRLVSLDSLRLLAVMISLGHPMERAPSELSPPVLKTGLDACWSHGSLGVDLFFVLSGLLVSGLLVSEDKKHGEISATRFYLRRGWEMRDSYHSHNEGFRGIPSPRRYALIIAGAALVCGSLLVGLPSLAYICTFGFRQHYLGAAAIVVGTLLCQIPRNLLSATLVTLGSYSYSIYLWHMAIFSWATPQMCEAGFSWSLRQAIFLGGALVIGITMAKLIELPTLRLRDRLFPSRTINPMPATSPLPASLRQRARPRDHAGSPLRTDGRYTWACPPLASRLLSRRRCDP